jgi:hypothetical protein
MLTCLRTGCFQKEFKRPVLWQVRMKEGGQMKRKGYDPMRNEGGGQ